MGLREYFSDIRSQVDAGSLQDVESFKLLSKAIWRCVSLSIGILAVSNKSGLLPLYHLLRHYLSALFAANRFRSHLYASACLFKQFD